MKLKLFFAICCMQFINVNAQQAPDPQDMKHYRIQLDNRTNQHLKLVPSQIIEAYCNGQLKAYYPKSCYTEVNFGDFLYHFKWAEPLNNEVVSCGENYCSNPSFIPFFERFNYYLDYYEHNYYDKRTGLLLRKVAFVQLAYTLEYDGVQHTFTGPLFRMDELEKLITIKTDNAAVTQSIKYVFDTGRFYAVEQTEYYAKTKERRTATEDDFQEH